VKWGRGKGSKRGRKMGVWGLDPYFSPALAPLPPFPLPHFTCYAGYGVQGFLNEGGP